MRQDTRDAMRYSCCTTARFRRRNLRNTHSEGADRAYNPDISSKVIAGCKKISTKASGTNTMYVKRTFAPTFTCLKLLNAKRLIMSAPAEAVTTNASTSPGNPTLV